MSAVPQKKADTGSAIKSSEPAEEQKVPTTSEKLASKSSRPKVSGLKAGFTDDNKQFNYFVTFLHDYQEKAAHYPIAIEERIVLRVEDSNHKPVVNAQVEVKDREQLLCSGKTYSDGTFLFFPSAYAADLTTYQATVTAAGLRQELAVARNGERQITVNLAGPRPRLSPVPLDVLFIFDTTGSMGEEIAQLKKTLEIIQMNLTETSVPTRLRLGMVLFRDRGDEYVTKLIPLTDDIEQFSRELAKVTADAGGDTPEDLQEALRVAMQEVKWNEDGIRLAFAITDAPPHLDYGQDYTYAKAAADAKRAGIKIFTIGSGGLDIAGEFVLRQISQYTYAKYIFLTYGEKSDSEGGKAGSVSHHVSDRFTSESLEKIIIRIAKEELLYLSEQALANVHSDNYAYVSKRAITDDEEYFTATRINEEKREETVQKLFDMAIGQLIDYSAKRIPPQTPTAVVPLHCDNAEMAENITFLTDRLQVSLMEMQKKNATFRILERVDLNKALDAIKESRSALFDSKTMPKIGEFVGAQMLVVGNLFCRTQSYDLHLKLLRVETGEILSATRAKIDARLSAGK
jgi:Mg-chelatase subunit ChlD